MPRRINDPVDTHIGRMIRLYRTARGMSQVDLSEAIGVTFQQVQKYENGANRVAASQLYRISRVLGVTFDAFFEDTAPATRSRSSVLKRP